MFLHSVKSLNRLYRHQKETSKSYVDGTDLAISCTKYFKCISKARIFLELLAYGIKYDFAHDLAIEGEGLKDLYNQFEVFNINTHKLKTAGWWIPEDNKNDYKCARSALFYSSFAKLNQIFRENNITDHRVIHIVGLRGLDQEEASHFKSSASVVGEFIWSSIPHCTYSSKPLIEEGT